MALQIYNSLSDKIDLVLPLSPGEVTMYVCGITPYDTTHLGHAFTYLSFDVLNRYLAYQGNKVKYVQNVTDIDDDILKRAGMVGKTWKELGDEWTKKFLDDMGNLNWIKPDPYVKATDTIDKIVEIVSDLITKGFAYEVNGTVYFEVTKFPDYGKLSQFNQDEMIKLSAERGANPDDPSKRNPLDFIMWQKKQDDEPSWSSPWGEGRPGWHIECSAMINKNLGNQIDIHGGGEDLIYPHHESEIAQSESFTGLVPFVKYWMHTGSVYYQGEKMSKSLGNLVLVSDLLKKHSANTIRFLLLSHHWKSPWEYKEGDMESAEAKMKELLSPSPQSSPTGGEEDQSLDIEFIEAMDDNLNTPKALEVLLTKKPANLKSHLELLGFSI